MVNAQAATGREIIGIEARVVVYPNALFTITELKGDKIILTEQLPEDSEDEPKVVTVTEKNALVAKYVRNPNTKPEPDAQIVNGKLTLVADGTIIDFGTLPIVDVLATAPGKIYLTADDNVADNIVTVMEYDVQSDTFTNLGIVLSDEAETVVVDDNKYVISNIIEKAKIDDGQGGQVTVDVAKECKVVLVSENGIYDSFLVTDSPIESVIPVSGGSIALRTDLMTGEDGYLIDAPSPMVRTFDDHGSLVARTLIKVGADPIIALGGKYDDVLTIVGNNYVIIKTNRGYIEVTDAAVVKAMNDGYTIFANIVGSTNDKDQQVTTITYANEDCDVITFIITDSDRGQLVALV